MIRWNWNSLLTAGAIGCIALAACAPEAAEDTATGDHADDAATAPGEVAIRDGLGTHHHRITTSSDSAQLYFDQGLRLSYAFNHPAAIASY